jgi:hypothetical protein
MVDVFVSYCHADVTIVRRLADGIEKHGFQSWWDRNMLPGQEFDRVIEKNISDAKCVIVVWSRHSVESRWVRVEAGEAMNQKKLVPARIDDCRIPLEFKRIQAAQLAGWNGDRSHHEFRQLLAGVRSIASPSDGEGARRPSTPQCPTTIWRVESKAFEWSGIRFTLTQGEIRYSIEYRNHWSYEAVYVNGFEICRGGSTKVAHPAFQFYIKNADGPSVCIIEPVYSALSKLFTVRLSKLKVIIDGKPLPEITR